MINHYYPADIAQELSHRWPAHGLKLPSQPQLTQLISVAYQASLLKEEGHPVECQIMYLHSHDGVNQEDLTHKPIILNFSPARSFTEQEIRRLSPTTRRGANVIAVGQDANGLSIWGMVVTDFIWNQSVGCHDEAESNSFNTLFIQVRSPGNIVFYCGSQQLLTLQNGYIEGHGFLQFPIAWIEGHFTYPHYKSGGSTMEFTIQEYRNVKEIVGELTLYFLRRSIFHVRKEGCGGLLVAIPDNAEEDFIGMHKPLEPKYRVHNNGERRFGEIMGAIINRLKAINALSWKEYQQSNDAILRALVLKLNVFADLLADLMAVDGALALNKRLDVLRFGTEIQVPQSEAFSVYKALDVEGNSLQPLPMNSGGTRHRAAYRLCFRHPACLVIVVSQDGTIQFVRHKEGKVVFWNQLEL